MRCWDSMPSHCSRSCSTPTGLGCVSLSAFPVADSALAKSSDVLHLACSGQCHAQRSDSRNRWPVEL